MTRPNGPTDTQPPRLARALLRRLLPRHEIADALEGDLHEAFTRRTATSPRRARWWYRRQVLTLPYLRLRRQIGRLGAENSKRESWAGGGWMSGMTMDLQVAIRSLLRRPAFTGVAVATLALSIGAATLLYSIVDGVLLTPLPYDEPDELLTVYITNDEWRASDNDMLRQAWNVQTMTLSHVEAFRSAPGPLEAIASYTYRRLPLDSGDGERDRAEAILVDVGVFPLLGTAPEIGRVLTRDEVLESAPVAVLRHDTWMERFGGDLDVLGRTFAFGEQSLSVVGVMPPGFFFPTENNGDFWTPITDEVRSWPTFYGVARLRPGASSEDATAFVEQVARRVGEDDADLAGLGARTVPHTESVTGSVRSGLQLLFGTALLVVLVACANVGNLFLARTAGRSEELAVRVSLGAGSGSLTSTVLAEVLVVGLVGGGLGVAFAAGLIEPIVEALATSMRGLPRQGEVALDLRVLLFSTGATLVTVVAAGLGPVVVATRRSPATVIGHRSGSGTGGATRHGQRLLLGVQGGLTVVLFLAAALLGRSFLAAASVETGMDVDNVAVLRIRADQDRYDTVRLVELYETLRRRVSADAAVASVGVVSSVPSRGGILLQRVRPEGSTPEDLLSVTAIRAGEGYFSSLGIPLVSGRGTSASDGTLDVAGVVVSESLARQMLGRTDVVGTTLLMESSEGVEELRVVGVADETRQLSVFQPPTPTLYYPMSRRALPVFFLTVGSTGDAQAALEAARSIVTDVDGTLRIAESSTLRAALDDSIRHLRLRMILMASLALLAGGLAMIGVSGVVAHFLSQQKREVGIRMALGAAVGREVGRVVRQALVPTLAGVTIGTGVALLASRVMESFVFEIEPTDPGTYLGVASLLVLTALLAAWIPARRAAAVDPVRVLKQDA